MCSEFLEATLEMALSLRTGLYIGNLTGRQNNFTQASARARRAQE